MGLKQRSVVLSENTSANFTRYIGDTLISDDDYQQTALGYRQLTISEGHPWRWLHNRNRPHWAAIGGPFYTEKVTLTGDHRHHVVKRGGRTAQGPIWAKKYVENLAASFYEDGSVDDAQLPIANPAILDEELLAMGTTAIARTIPTNPIFDAATFVGELREGLPSLIGAALFKRQFLGRSVAEENLNWEFGLKPIINDFKAYTEASREGEARLAQLRRDSEKPIRRRFDFPTQRTTSRETSEGVFSSGAIVGGGAFLQKLGTLVEREFWERDVWFSGCYQYTLPPEGSNLRRISELDAIYGVRPSAATVYNLAPWSWCLDWFTNTGDVVHNLSAFSQDGLLLKYGYIMCRTRHVKSYTWTGTVQNASTADAWVPHVAHQEVTYETKQRLPATPYGFGLAYSDLTPRQLGILGSLGILRTLRPTS